MKYILLVAALILPQCTSPQSAFKLNDAQCNDIADCSIDAGLDGALIGLEYAVDIYQLQDHSHETIAQKIKAIRWYYVAIGAATSVVVAAQADYLTCVLMNSLDNYYNRRN